MEGIIRDLKSYTSRKIRLNLENLAEVDINIQDMLSYLIKEGANNPANYDFQLWQKGYHGVELSTNNMIEQRLEYIHNNPNKAGLCEFPEQWKWSSAIDYHGGKGLLEIIHL